GVAPELAAHAARASQGHIGRAKALAKDEATRIRRQEIVSLPIRLTSLGSCMTAATNLFDVAKEEAEAITSALDAREKADLDSAFGVVERGRRPREYAPALSALEKGQKTRAKRRILDVVDRGLMDLVSVYRDAIVLATVPAGSGTELVNAEMRQDLERLVRVTTPESNLARITAVFTAREQMLEFNVPAQLALESMMVGLRLPEGQRP
ncbi:MAG TPA: DNA polymerase III subunit delta', partial [Nocardioides sp.]